MRVFGEMPLTAFFSSSSNNKNRPKRPSHRLPRHSEPTKRLRTDSLETNEPRPKKAKRNSTVLRDISVLELNSSPSRTLSENPTRVELGGKSMEQGQRKEPLLLDPDPIEVIDLTVDDNDQPERSIITPPSRNRDSIISRRKRPSPSGKRFSEPFTLMTGKRAPRANKLAFVPLTPPTSRTSLSSSPSRTLTRPKHNHRSVTSKVPVTPNKPYSPRFTHTDKTRKSNLLYPPLPMVPLLLPKSKGASRRTAIGELGSSQTHDQESDKFHEPIVSQGLSQTFVPSSQSLDLRVEEHSPLQTRNPKSNEFCEPIVSPAISQASVPSSQSLDLHFPPPQLSPVVSRSPSKRYFAFNSPIPTSHRRIPRDTPLCSSSQSQLERELSISRDPFGNKSSIMNDPDHSSIPSTPLSLTTNTNPDVPDFAFSDPASSPASVRTQTYTSPPRYQGSWGCGSMLSLNAEDSSTLPTQLREFRDIFEHGSHQSQEDVGPSRSVALPDADTEDSATESESESDIAAFRASLVRKGARRYSQMDPNCVEKDRQAADVTPRQLPRARGLGPDDTLPVLLDANTMACSYDESGESLPSVVKYFRAMFEDDGSLAE